MQKKMAMGILLCYAVINPPLLIGGMSTEMGSSPSLESFFTSTGNGDKEEDEESSNLVPRK